MMKQQSIIHGRGKGFLFPPCRQFYLLGRLFLLFCALMCVATLRLKAQAGTSWIFPFEINVETASALDGASNGYSFSSDVITLNVDGGYYLITGNTTITNRSRRIVVEAGTMAVPRTVYVQFAGLNMSCDGAFSAFAINGDNSIIPLNPSQSDPPPIVTTVYLTITNVNSLQSGTSFAGLYVHPTAKLVIEGSGQLTSQGGNGENSGPGYGGGAGIGGNAIDNNTSISPPDATTTRASGAITIKSGVIIAIGGNNGGSDTGGGAGIGGGGSFSFNMEGGSSVGPIEIEDGTVTATGGNSSGTGVGSGGGAGIGGGGGSGSYPGSGGKGGDNSLGITISGGTVTATGGDSGYGGGGAGIGGGGAHLSADGGHVGVVLITGGTVITAGGTGYSPEFNGPGIGNGGQPDNTVTREIKILQEPSDITVVANRICNSRINLNASLSPSGTLLNYQWFSNNNPNTYDGLNTNLTAAGAFPYYELPDNLDAGVYYYYCELSAQDATSLRSRIITVTVDPTPSGNITLIDITANSSNDQAITQILEFDSRTLGYSTVPYLSIRVDNETNHPFVGTLNCSPLLTVAYSNFEFNDVATSDFLQAQPTPTLAPLPLNGSVTFSLLPISGLGLGKYTATITVSDGAGISESFDVQFNVVAKVLQSIEISVEPTKQNYIEAEELDLSGLEVTLHYAGSEPPEIVLFADFATNQLTTSLANGTPLLRDVSVTVSQGNVTSPPIDLTITQLRYFVTVDSEGSGASGGGWYTYNSPVSIDAGTPPASKEFSHWTASHSDVLFTDDQEAITSFTFDEEQIATVTVTAVFKTPNDDQLTVTFMLDEHNVYDEEFLETGDLIPEPVEPTLVDHAFLGWVDKDGVFWNFNTPVEDDLTLYAKFILKDNLKEQFTVRFTIENKFWYNQLVDKDDLVPVPDKPVKNNFELKGWFTGGSASAWNFNTPVVGDMTLNAVFVQKANNWVTVIFTVEGKFWYNEFVEVGNRVSAPDPEPVMDDNVLIGWYKDGSSTTIWDFTKPVVANMELDAKFETINLSAQYVVTFTVDGIFWYRELVSIGQTVDMPYPDPVKEVYGEEYILTGWYNNGIPWNFNTKLTNSMLLNAEFEPLNSNTTQRIVTFMTSADKIWFKKLVVHGQSVERPANPIQEDQIFTGWYAEPECLTFWDFRNPITSDMLLYAGWEQRLIDNYGVVFIGNGGTFANSSNHAFARIPAGEVIGSLKPDDPARDNYEFTGWYEDPDCAPSSLWNTETMYVTEDMFLFAGWKADILTVTFHANGGKFGAEDEITIEAVFNEPVNLPYPFPTKDNSAFTGWYKDPYGAELWDFSQPVTESMTLYADWEQRVGNRFAVVFIDIGGDPAHQVIFVNENEPFSENIPIPKDRTGFVFTGWYQQPACETLWNFNNAVTDDMFLFAGWVSRENNRNYVIFVGNGGTPDHQIVRIDGISVAPPAIGFFYNPGHVLTGWYTEASCENPYNFDSAVTDDLFLYAGWEPMEYGTYVVIFVGNGGKSDGEDYVISRLSGINDVLPVFARDGYMFTYWYHEDGSLWDQVTLFDGMFLFAGWEEIDVTDVYTVTVNSKGIGASLGGLEPVGASVPIHTGDDPPNLEFQYWTGTGIDLTNLSDKRSFTFVMPRNDVTLTAVYWLKFESFIVTKWDNTFMLDFTKLNEFGYLHNDKNTVCTWYLNDSPLNSQDPRGLTYTVDPQKDTPFTPGDRYYFVITNGVQTDRSTVKTINSQGKSASLLAYPNPVQAGSMFSIEGVSEGSPIQVYNQAGVCVLTTIATGNPVQLALHVPPGLYLVRTPNGDVKIVVNN